MESITARIIEMKRDGIKALISGMIINEPANSEAIRRTEKGLNFAFPSDFFQFLLVSNGVSGYIDTEYLEIWAVEDILASNRAIEIEKYVPGLIAFGGDGANELYAFDGRNALLKIVQIPMIGMDLDSIWECAATFEEFLMAKTSSR
jgi:SMI1 / KNR4 family (SUKH-1)